MEKRSRTELIFQVASLIFGHFSYAIAAWQSAANSFLFLIQLVV
jgi:hypothetical protein